MIINGIYRDFIVHDDQNIKGFFGDFRWLSNFHVSDVYYEDVLYPSSENAYQAAKSIDPKIREKFINITPSESKKLGRKIEMRDDWDDIKFKVMFDICLNKFTRNKELQQKLINTGEKYLEETNYWNDQIYGVCNGIGKNMLGKILMDIRQKLINGYFVDPPKDTKN